MDKQLHREKTERTFQEVKEKLQSVFAHRKAWRIEVGTLLLTLRMLAEYGQWSPMLAELGISDSTASDYMNEARKEITGFRGFPEPASSEALALFPPADDPEGLEIEAAIANAISDVESIGGRPQRAARPSHKNRTRDHIVLENHVCIRPTLYVSGDESDWYDTAWKTNRDHLHSTLVAALRNAMAETLVREEVLA
jgi:hypothetical protein